MVIFFSFLKSVFLGTSRFMSNLALFKIINLQVDIIINELTYK